MAKSDMNTEYHRYMQEAEGHGVRDVNKMAEYMFNHVSLDDMTRDELELFFHRVYCASRLTQDGYRVPAWGSGLYVNPDDCGAESLIRIFNSAKDAQKAKDRLLNIYKTKTIQAGIPGQYEIDFVTKKFKPQMSDEEFLQKLIDDIAV